MSSHLQLGFSLSGGSFGSLCYASFLHTLKNEYDITPDILAGLSGGAMVAPMIAAGMNPEEIYQVFSHLHIKDIINVRHLTDFELIDHEKFTEFFRQELPVQRFENLEIPVLIFATDVENQKTEIISSGDIPTAITASCSIYPLMHPVQRMGKLLTDGGYTTYYGAQYLHQHGADKVVGIDVTGLNEGTTPAFFKSMYLSINAALTSNSRYELEKYPVDIDIRLEAKSPSIFKLEEQKELLLETGREAAHTYASQITQLVASK